MKPIYNEIFSSCTKLSEKTFFLCIIKTLLFHSLANCFPVWHFVNMLPSTEFMRKRKKFRLEKNSVEISRVTSPNNTYAEKITNCRKKGEQCHSLISADQLYGIHLQQVFEERTHTLTLCFTFRFHSFLWDLFCKRMAKSRGE